MDTKQLNELLPELSEEETKNAREPGVVAWVYSLMGGLRIGDFHDADGVMFQILDHQTVRVLRIFDHPKCLWYFAMFRETFGASTVTMQEDGIILTPVVEMGTSAPMLRQPETEMKTDEGSAEAPTGVEAVGMEVV